MARHRAVLLLGLALCGGAQAAPQGSDLQQVQVNALRDPEMHSYRAVVAGLDEYEADHRRLAPLADGLRFHVLARGEDNGGTAEALALRIASEDESFPVPVSPDGHFSVPRIAAAYDGNADLILNRKKHTFRILPEVRTPGLPDNVRRLGDIRLECKVRIAIVKQEMPFWANALVNSLLMTTDWCSKLGLKHGSYYVSTTAPVAHATLRDGERTLALKARRSEFEVPVADPAWPDDALIELEFGAQ